MIINTTMKINYKVEIDFVKSEEVTGFDNVIYNVGYNIKVWEGSKTENQVMSDWEKLSADSEIPVDCPVISSKFVEKFEFDPEIASEFIPIDQLTTEILTDWLIGKYGFSSIEEFYPVKNAIDKLRPKTEISNFTPIERSVSV